MKPLLRTVALGLFASMLVFSAGQADASSKCHSSHWYYRNHPEGFVTAICQDGSQSCSHHRSGTCSSHGGVDHFL
jgi:Protein of unknown function (DUF3761)